MEAGFKSDLGNKRKLNEDSVLCFHLDTMLYGGTCNLGLFIVADGMGGHNAGELASSLAVKTIAMECLPIVSKYTDKPLVDTNKPGLVLSQAVLKANSKVYDMAKNDAELQGMGTTATAALLIDQDIYIAQVGDSRCYIVNNRGIAQVTTDHSLVQEMVDAHKMTSEEALSNPHKNIITRVIGYSESVDVDSYHQKLYDGDAVLLCSDGLWGMIPDQLIKETILSSASPEESAYNLIKEAREAGGLDNISAIVIKPINLPKWDEIAVAETQITKPDIDQVEDQTKRIEVPKRQKKLFSWFNRK